MSEAVYDASFCAALLTSEIHSDQAENLLRQYPKGFAPLLWHYEMSNIVVKKIKSGVFSYDNISHQMMLLDHLSIEFFDNNDIKTLSGVSLEYDLSGYDAAYLHLAIDLNLPLLTFDKKLGAAAEKAGLPVIDA